jgi:hypothetical protein
MSKEKTKAEGGRLNSSRRRQPFPMDTRMLGNFQEELHASSYVADRPKRTPYFYNSMAKRFLRWLDSFEWISGSQSTGAALARTYRDFYRGSKEEWSKHFGLNTGGAS